MKRNFYLKLFFIVCSFFLCITVVSAKECTTQELRELKHLAKKIEIGYEFNESANIDDSYFSLLAYNSNNKFYFMISDTYVYATRSKEPLGYFSPEKEIKVKIYASTKTNCQDEFLRNVIIDLPSYNKYYKNGRCLNHKNNDICKKWYDTSLLTDDEFLRRIDEIEKSEKKMSFVDGVISVLKKYGIYITIIIVIIIIILLICNKAKKSKKQKIEL